MEKNENLKHWENWAKSHKTELLATTKCTTIKMLEIANIDRSLSTKVSLNEASLLEVGCGNGVNGLALLDRYPQLKYMGVDFSQSMIDSAMVSCADHGSRCAFKTADARNLTQSIGNKKFDVVFTDRMLINLESHDEQLKVMHSIADALNSNGIFLMLENSVQSHAALNQVRIDMGLPIRPPAEYNIFIDDHKVIDKFKSRMKLIATEYISGIHDVMLYAVYPKLNNGNINYDTAEMKALTSAIESMLRQNIEGPKGVGQNVLWLWQKTD